MVNTLFLVFAMVAVGESGATDKAQEFISVLEPRTALHSFRGKCELTSHWYRGEERVHSRTFEYRFSGADTYGSAVSLNPSEDGLYDRTIGVYYKGTVKFRMDSLRPDGNLTASPGLGFLGEWEKRWPFAEWLTPRLVVGEQGRAAEGTSAIHGVALVEYLRAPGPFYYTEQGPYRILCHSANVGKDVIPRSADIWLDANNDLARIDIVTRPWDAPPEVIQKYYKGDFYDLYVLRVSLEMGNHVDVGNGVRFPRHARQTYWYANEEKYDQLMRGLRESGASLEEIAVQQILRMEMELGLDETAEFDLGECAFNVPLTEDDFQLEFPTGAIVYRDFSRKHEVVGEPGGRWWFLRGGIVIPFVFLVAVTALLVWAGKRHLGWRW